MSLTAYKLSLEIMNYTELIIINRLFKIKSTALSLPDGTPKWLLKLYNGITSPFVWLFHNILKPILFILFGILTSIKSYYILLISIILIVMFLYSNIFGAIFQLEYDQETFSSIIISFFLIVILFKKIPSHGFREDELLNLITDKIKSFDLNEKQLSLIMNNIDVYQSNFKKRVVFISSLLIFIWGSFILIFNISRSYLSVKDVSLDMVINMIQEPMIWYLVFFLIIRVYSKVYNYIFDLVQLAINETKYDLV